jgi:hypothetical protein
MGILIVASRRQRNADLGQGFDGTFAGLRAACRKVLAIGLADLLADGEDRIERGERCAPATGLAATGR